MRDVRGRRGGNGGENGGRLLADSRALQRVVTAKLADVGAMAAPGVPLLIVEDQGHFRLEATVDESKMGAVRLGESVPVVIDALGDRAFTGKVVQICRWPIRRAAARGEG